MKIRNLGAEAITDWIFRFNKDQIVKIALSSLERR
jgi:hypothetical protein